MAASSSRDTPQPAASASRGAPQPAQCGLTARLLSDVELGNGGSGNARTAEDISVERMSNFEAAIAASLVLGVLCAGAVLFGLFLWEWQQETSYRPWLLLACVAPLSYAANAAWFRGLRVVVVRLDPRSNGSQKA